MIWDRILVGAHWRPIDAILAPSLNNSSAPGLTAQLISESFHLDTLTNVGVEFDSSTNAQENTPSLTDPIFDRMLTTIHSDLAVEGTRIVQHKHHRPFN